MATVHLEANIRGLGDVFYCNNSSFTDASNVVLEKSDELISLRDLAYAQMVEAKRGRNWRRSSLCTNNSYVKEGSLFDPKSSLHNFYARKSILLRESLVLQNPSDAVTDHQFSNEYVPKNFNLEEYLEQIGKDNYLVVTREMLSTRNSIPTDKFGENPLTVWAFSDQAEKYGLFLRNADIYSIKIWTYGNNSLEYYKESQPIANQLFLNDFYALGISCNGKNLNYNVRVRGVHHELVENNASPNTRLYDSIKKLLKPQSCVLHK